jgi:hypothetical protein
LRAGLADEGVPLETRVAERLTGRQGEVGDLVDHDLRSTGHDRGLQAWPSNTSTTTGRAPAARIRAAPSADRDVP